jgi:ribosomal protein S18 acetylase RimI-like enzyme
MEASSRGSSRAPSGASAARLRPLSRADRGALERILRECGAFREEEIAVALELVDAPAEEGYRFLVAEADGQVAGYACFGATPMTRGTWDLYWIAVDPRRQRGGIGRSLLRGAEDAVRTEGGRRLLVETAGKASYAPTRAMYEACGYREVARVPDFYEEGDDKVIYAALLAPNSVRP